MIKITRVVCIFLLLIFRATFAYSCFLTLETKNNSHKATININMISVGRNESLVHFQLCFIPAFPNEIPDYFWKTEESHCYITKDTDRAYFRYTAIGRPIRLLDFPVTVAQTLIRQGNGFFEIEDFRYRDNFKHPNYPKHKRLSITIRKNIYSAGQYVCHIFQLNLASSLSKSAVNEIQTLGVSSKLTIPQETKYCYILPAYDEHDELIFEIHDLIRFICDLCWFEMTKPNFMVSFHFS